MNKTLLSNQNHLYDLARRNGLRLPGGLSETARRWIDRLYPLLAIAFSLVTPFVASLFALVPILILMAIENSSQLGSVSPDLKLLVELLSSFLPIYFIVWIWVLIAEKRHLWTLGFEWTGAFRKYINGGLLGIAIFSAAVGLMALFGDIRLAARPAALGFAELGGVVLLLAGWIVQGGAEEVLARGYLLPVVGSHYGTVLGIIISSLVFASWHLFNPNLSVLAVVNLALYGLFAAFYALHEGGLWGVCAFHSLWNWVQGNFFGFEVSGGTFGASTLFKFQEVGPDWFTGGSFGPEGGLAVTLVLVAGCIWLLLASARKKSLQAELVN